MFTYRTHLLTHFRIIEESIRTHRQSVGRSQTAGPTIARISPMIKARIKTPITMMITTPIAAMAILITVIMTMAITGPAIADDIAVPKDDLLPKDAVTVVEEFHATLLEAMRLDRCADRYALLLPVITKGFDLDRIARLSTGSFWKNMSGDEQRDFTRALARSTVASYADNFSGYDGEMFHTLKEKKIGAGWLIQTALVINTDKSEADGNGQKDGKNDTVDRVRFDYLLRRDGDGHWRVVDILLKGAYSELAAKRSQYLAVLRGDGAAALIKRIIDKIPSQCDVG